MRQRARIHLRTHPDNAAAKPAECGATMQATLNDIPAAGSLWDGLVCKTCIRKRRARLRGVAALK